MLCGIHYVYMLYRLDGRPFYVGMGKGDRWIEHERVCRTRLPNSHKNRIIREILDRGLRVPKVKLASGLTRSEAASLEIATIALIGREPAGPLVNHTRGGDGLCNPSEEVRRRIAAATAKYKFGNTNRRGKKNSEESKAKARACQVGRAKPKISERLAGNRNGEGNRGKPKSEKTKAKMRAAARRRVAEGRHHKKPGCALPPAVKEKIAAKNRERMNDPVERAKIDAGRNAYWAAKRGQPVDGEVG